MSREAKIERRRLAARRVFEALCAHIHKCAVLVQRGDLKAERAYHIEHADQLPATRAFNDFNDGAAMRLAPVWSMLVAIGNGARIF